MNIEGYLAHKYNIALNNIQTPLQQKLAEGTLFKVVGNNGVWNGNWGTAQTQITFKNADGTQNPPTAIEGPFGGKTAFESGNMMCLDSATCADSGGLTVPSGGYTFDFWFKWPLADTTQSKLGLFFLYFIP